MNILNTNHVILIGRLTEGPKLYTSGGGNVCGLRLEVIGMGPGRSAAAINVTVKGRRGKKANECLTAGSLVAVDGRLAYGERGPTGKRLGVSVVGRVELLADPQSVSNESAAPATASKPTRGRRRNRRGTGARSNRSRTSGRRRRRAKRS